jgi:hypothetical protein
MLEGVGVAMTAVPSSTVRPVPSRSRPIKEVRSFQ